MPHHPAALPGRRHFFPGIRSCGDMCWRGAPSLGPTAQAARHLARVAGTCAGLRRAQHFLLCCSYCLLCILYKSLPCPNTASCVSGL